MDIRNPIPTNGGDWTLKFGELWKKQIQELQGKFGSVIEEVKTPFDAPTDVPILYVKKEEIVHVIKYAKEAVGFDYNFLSDITATDEESEFRFEIVYNLLSHSSHARIRFKVRARENELVPTLVGVWKGANWAEREVFDMYGVKFSGHPDLRRILMDERWVGHPLRKDYPIKGYQIFTDAQPVNPTLLE